MSTEIKVLTKNLEVNEFYFSFDYTIFWNRKFLTKGTYESDHEGQDLKEFEKDLKNRGMVMLALEQIR